MEKNKKLALSTIKLNFPYVEIVLNGKDIVFSGEVVKDILEKEYDRLYSLEMYFGELGYSTMLSDSPTHFQGKLKAA